MPPTKQDIVCIAYVASIDACIQWLV